MASRDPLVLERQLRLHHLARALDGALRAVHDDAEHVRRFTQHLYRNRTAFGPLPPRTYAHHPKDGYTWCPKDEGGSAIIVSSRTTFDATARDQAVLTEHLDPLLFDVLRRNPCVVQCYFSTEETICRIAPWFNVEEAAALKLLAPDFDIRESSYPFYHRANREMNPGRTVVWTDLYLDPIGRGWMVSCLAPVYLDDGSLRGVVGLDVTVARLAEALGVASEVDPLLLLSSDGIVLVGSPAARERFPMAGDRPRLDASESGREIMAAINRAPSGQVEIRDDLVWRRIAETGWTLLSVFSRREGYEELEQRSRVLALAQRLMMRSDAADVASSVAQATRTAFAADGAALWWAEGRRFRRVVTDGVEIDPSSFASPAGAMAAAAATPGRAQGSGTGLLMLAVGSPGQTRGFLAVQRAAPFGEEDAHFFEILGHTAALGLENVAQFRRLAQAQKMEGLGTVAAAVAHDFNNLLGSILGNASLLRLSLAQVDEHTRRIIEIIESSAQRGAALTRQLLQFSRTGGTQRGPASVSMLFTDVLGFLRQSLARNVRVEVILPASLPSVEMDTVQMQQVLANLCINARDAMAGGGTLTLTAAAKEPPESLGGGEGPWVMIEVRDTGVGMAPEVLNRVFDPFYTTKPAGKGTGLGLPIAQRIVRDHQGVIDLMSEVGKRRSTRRRRRRKCCARATAKRSSSSTTSRRCWRSSPMHCTRRDTLRSRPRADRRRCASRPRGKRSCG